MQFRLTSLLALLALLIPLSSLAQWSASSDPALAGIGGQEEFLPVEEAYVLNSEFEAPGQLRLNWQIAEGYYLYRNGFKFSLLADGREIPRPLRAN